MAARRYKDQQVRRALTAAGFTFVRHSGSAHEIYQGPNGFQPIVISLGHSKGVSEFTLKAAIRLGGVPWSEFERYL